MSVPEVQEDSNFTLTVAGEHPYINNRNETDVAIQIVLKEPLEKAQTFTVELSGISDGTGLFSPANGMIYTTSLKVKIPANTTKVVVAGEADPENGVIAWENGEKFNATDVIPGITFGSSGKTRYADGTITVKLKDSNGKVIDEYTIEKHSDSIKNDGITEIVTERTGTKKADVSFTAYGESKIVKVYYEYVENTTETHQTLDSITENTKSISVINNKYSGQIASDLEEKKSYNLYYVLEDEFGSRSDVLGPVVITTDGEDVKQYSKVEKVTLPDLTTGKLDNLKASWALATDGSAVKPEASGAKYIVTLYNGGTAVYAEEVTGSIDTTEFELSKVKTIMSKPGTYKIGVAIPSDSTHTASEVAFSNEVTVKQLDSVSNVRFEARTDGNYIVWDSNYETDDIKEYQLTVQKVNSNGTLGSTVINNQGVNAKEFKDENSKIVAGTIYRANVTVIAKDNQASEVTSEEANSKDFFYIATGTVDVQPEKTTANSVTLKLAAPITVNGKETKYYVEVSKVQTIGNHDNYVESYKVPAELVKNGDDYVLVVDGLTENTEYAFRVFAEIEGIEGVSVFTDKTKTKKSMPALENLTVSDTAGEGMIFEKTDGTVLNINEEDYTVSEYPTLLKQMADLIDPNGGLHVGDKVVKFDGETLAVELGNKEATRTFDKKLAGLKVEFVGDDFARTLTTSSTESEMPAEVTLKGAGALFTVTGLNAKKIVLDNGVDVTTAKVDGTQKLVLAAGANVTLNKFGVSASVETTIAPKEAQLLITPTGEANNNLTFTNSSNLTVIFDGEAGFGSTQKGTITLNANGGTLVVMGDRMNVAANINVNATAGNVILTEPTLSGTKTVLSASKDAQIEIKKALPDNCSTVTLTNFELKEYNDLTSMNAVSGTISNLTTEEQYQSLQAWINSFGLNDKATITTSNGNVTITFTNSVSNVIL